MFFWAWNGPKTSASRSKNAGVAFLAKTIYVPPQMRTRATMQVALSLSGHDCNHSCCAGTPLIAVVRMKRALAANPQRMLREVRDPRLAPLSLVTNQRLLDEIVELQKLPYIRAIQTRFRRHPRRARR